MRLVDADMITLYLIVEGQNYPDKYGFSCGDTIKFSPSEVKKIIQKMPTIEERKTGKWEMKPDPYGFFEEIPVCSECGYTTEMRKTYNFCPNCGARMEGSKDEVD